MDFLSEYYLWFVIGGIILLMALIGYIADKTDFGRKDIAVKKTKPEKTKEETEIKTVESENNDKVVEETIADVSSTQNQTTETNSTSVDITDINPFVMPEQNIDVNPDNNISASANENIIDDEDIDIKEVTDDSTFTFNNDLSSFAAGQVVDPLVAVGTLDNNVPEVIGEDVSVKTSNDVIDNSSNTSLNNQETEDDIWKF